MGVQVRHEPCDACGSSNNLAVWTYEDGSETRWCFSEGCANKETKRRPQDAKFTLFKDRLVPKDIENLLSIQTLSAYEIRIDRSGVQPKIMFVYRETDGRIIKAKTRDYSVPKKSTNPKHFNQVGKTHVHSLYGKESRRGSRCIIVGGEWDAPAAREMTGYTAVSLDNGEGNVNAVKADLEYLESFEIVYICLDNDDTGIEGTEKILEVLPHAIPVLLPMLPTEEETYTKDAWDFLKYGYIQEFRDAINSAKGKTPAFILEAAELMNRAKNFLYNKDQNRGWSFGIPGIDNMLGGLRESEVTILAADPGKGKSTLARYIIGSTIRAKKKVLYISLEDEPERAAVRLMEMLNNIKLINAPKPSDDELLRMMEPFTNGDIQMSDCTSLNPDDLEKQVRWAVSKTGVKLVVLDHITIAAQSMQTGQLNQNVSLFMSRINALKKKFKVHFVVITHNHRPEKQTKETVQAGVENDPVPTYRDAFGSSGIEQLCDNYLAIRMLKSGLIELYLLKNRLWEILGKVTLRYRNGSYEQTKEEQITRGALPTETTHPSGGTGERNRASSMAEPPRDETPKPALPDVPVKDREDDELYPGLRFAKRVINRNQRVPDRGMDEENVTPQGAVPL